MWPGGLLAAALAAFLAAAFLEPWPRWPAVVLVWSAVALGWRRIDPATRRLALLLLAAGAAAEVAAVRRGAPFEPVAMGAVNLPIVALFLGVAFLALVPRPEPGPASRRAGLWQSLASVHLVGAVINMSAVAIAGDRLARDGRLGRREAVLLARGYCAAAFWSPFFVAAAVAHTYAPAADARVTLPLGLAGAAAALLLTAREVARLDPEPFAGFAPDRSAVVLTVSLLVTVVAVKVLVPATPVVVIVAAVTPPLALLLAGGAGATAFADLLRRTLPANISQVALFLAAGVFAHGASILLAATPDLVPLDPAAATAWIHPAATAVIVGAAYLGLHPVITIAALASVLAPMDVDPSLTAFSYLAGWAIGTAVAPLSGMNLYLIGRYRLRPRQIARWGPGYALTMLMVVAALSWLGGRFLAL